MPKNTDPKLPKSINVGGIVYKVLYVDKASDTDVEGRQAIWGQIDYWTRTIRIYQKNRAKEDIWQTLLHEILHAISEQFRLNLEDRQISTEEEIQETETSFVDVFSLILFDTLSRNGLLKM